MSLRDSATLTRRASAALTGVSGSCLPIAHGHLDCPPSGRKTMAEANNKILTHMLERLFAGMLSGPNLNCRPHSSRQRADLTHLEKLRDLEPARILWQLLGPD